MILPASKTRGPAEQAAQSGSGRPGLGILLNGFTPYNVHHCRRVASEIPELESHCAFTIKEKLWDQDVPREINAVHFGDSDRARAQGWTGFRLQDIRTGDRIFEHFRTHNVQAVVLAGYASLLHLRLLSRCHRAGLPVFLRSDSNIESEREQGPIHRWVKRRLLKWVLGRCAGVMPMGELGRRYYEKYGADLSHCYLVPHEPDYRLFGKVKPSTLADFRKRHGLRSERRYLLSCCRLVPQKRVDLLLDAYAGIAADRPDWDLLLLGEGPLRAELEARVPDRLVARVHWLGFCQVEEVRVAYHAADVFVLPSDYEPWAVVVNEAAAAGLVTVASDVVGAAEELVKDRMNGRIFRSGDVHQLTDALLDVTDLGTYERYRQQVAPVLEAWRRRADPVESIRQALRSVGVLPRAASVRDQDDGTATVASRAE